MNSQLVIEMQNAITNNQVLLMANNSHRPNLVLAPSNHIATTHIMIREGDRHLHKQKKSAHLKAMTKDSIRLRR